MSTPSLYSYIPTLMVCVCLLVLGVGAQTAHAQFWSGGAGTEADPYQIADCEDLQNMRLSNASHYVLTNDIDCSETASWNEGAGFAPVEVFEASFDGAGYTIFDLTINREEADEVGLFEYALDHTIKNVNFDGADIAGAEYVGVVAGRLINSTVENVYATDIDVSGDSKVGGLFGYILASNGEGSVTRASASGEVSASGSHLGGIAGQAASDFTAALEINTVRSNTVLSGFGETNVGGIFGDILSSGAAGFPSEMLIRNAYAWGAVYANASSNVGGLIGRVSSDGAETNIEIANTYVWSVALDTLEADQNAGGLIGEITGSGDLAITQSFAGIEIMADGGAGGLIGVNTTSGTLSFTGNYYDVSVTGIDICSADEVELSCGKVNSEGTESSYFFNNNVNPPLDSWDFSGIWEISDETPPVFRSFGIEPEPDAPTTYTLSFDTQGGSVVDDIEDLEEGADVALPVAPTRTGYTFHNWNTMADGSGTAYAALDTFKMPASDTTFYAVWEAEEVADEEESRRRSPRSSGTVFCTATRTTFCASRTESAPPQDTISIEDIVHAHRDLLLLAHQSGIALPPYILELLSVVPSVDLVRDLEYGMEGEDVRQLQTLLIGAGYAIPSGATGVFLNETRDALVAYQSAHDIAPAIGYFGTVTREHMKSSGVAGVWW